ncbi:MAG TPA: hypothetical protein VMY35_19190 [Phycisphaerae bacterium]|nr:hypothetical protein [Phycisphaerae bacterium]
MSGQNSTRQDGSGGFTVFPADWFAEETLKFVSFAAQGLWINIIFLLHRSPIRGELRRGDGSKMDGNALATVLGRTPDQVLPALQELIDHGVCSTLDDGTVYSRRMRRGKSLKEKRKDAGLLGARERWQGDSTVDGKGMANQKTDGKRGKGKERKGVVTEKDVVVLPESLQTKDFVSAWEAWEKYRKETRHALTPSTIRLQLKKLEAVGPTVAAAMINQSIERGWRGLFELDQGGTKGTTDGKPSGRTYRASKKCQV